MLGKHSVLNHTPSPNTFLNKAIIHTHYNGNMLIYIKCLLKFRFKDF
jgi:hypothetical protein